MKRYIEFTLIDNSTYNFYELWSKFYTQLHLALVEMRNTYGNIPIGVSFPEYVQNPKCRFLGAKLRLFAAEEKIFELLKIPKWLEHLEDYIHYTSIRHVPTYVDFYAIYQRHHPKTNVARLIKRYAKRKHLPLKTASSFYANFEEKRCDLPFIRLKSLTNSHDFNLYIQKKVIKELVDKGFGTYGLSPSSSVPEF